MDLVDFIFAVSLLLKCLRDLFWSDVIQYITKVDTATLGQCVRLLDKTS